MGRRILIDNSGSGYKIWNTVVDDVTHEFESKEELLEFMALELIYKGKEKAIEQIMLGIDGFYVGNDMRYSEDNIKELKNEYKKFTRKLNKTKTYEEYYSMIDSKLEELFGRRV